MSIDYKSAGVDVEAGYRAVDLMRGAIRSTYDENVLGDVGSFGGLYSIAGFKMEEPVLVSGTDGVGTKLKIAFAMDKHDTIGIDCVAMCANDVACQGAKPLFFLDYMATGKLEPQKAASIVSGVAEGCRQAGCALIGGETAEMPGFYSEGEYDLAGFCVGIADKKDLITGNKIKQGDVLIGLKSSGVHSNGFSLIRKLVGENRNALSKYYDDLGKTIGEELLTPTTIYVRALKEIGSKVMIKGVSHITGGGFIENIPRMFPQGLMARIDTKSYELPPVFDILWKLAGIDARSIYNTFNMGIGMVLCVDEKDADKAIEISGGVLLGSVEQGSGVELK